MYYVYWIKAAHHDNILDEGYVGITKNFNERMKAHCKNKRNSKLVAAKTKYGWSNLIKEILFEGLSLEAALEIERAYRPSLNIGWNHQRGGELGVESSWYDLEDNRTKHSKQTSIATKIGISKKDTKEARSERAKKNWEMNRDSYKGSRTGEKNPKAVLTEEEVHFIKYTLLPYKIRDKEIASYFDVKDYVIGFIRKGKNWSHI
jgi:predicted GIY-YIG superfamily endonuclease